ncbi:siderophore-interacting protein [Nocardioides sp. JQ2195]|uniref:siderophore-interacting protein n=1 Tax=Nocardioides sp. JQ2195 TaxID=2592334 RepID=UPI00143E7059|nr:siderophore-interacting protein [Nocardioides sp. JQ2195]QIX26331.1 siderophore-interacting protein [Nocardioides sp. JQ2195]
MPTQLTVRSTEQLTPHLVRVHFSGDLAGFADSVDTDRYVKLIFQQPGVDHPDPLDLNALRGTLPPEQMPILRTYTVRSLDVPAGTLAIDFVVHGDEGVAGPWAAAAQPGDVILANGPGGGYAPRPDVDWHLLGSDEAGLPAVAAAIESLPAGAVARVLVEVADEDDVIELGEGENVEVTWLLRGAASHDVPDDRAGRHAPLVQAIRDLEWLPGTVQVFVHGEAAAVMHGVRPFLFKEKGLPRDAVSISGYWRRGRTEEGFREWKQDLARSEA